MRVKDLIKKLQQYDENMKVYIEYRDDLAFEQKVEWTSYSKIDGKPIAWALFDSVIQAKRTVEEKNWYKPTFEDVLNIRLISDELERWSYDKDGWDDDSWDE